MARKSKMEIVRYTNKIHLKELKNREINIHKFLRLSHVRPESGYDIEFKIIIPEDKDVLKPDPKLVSYVEKGYTPTKERKYTGL